MERGMARQVRISFFAGLFSLLPVLTWAGPIHIGSISTKPASELKKFLPFATYLAQELGSQGVDQGKVVVAQSIPQMAAYMREGRVDLFIDSPFPALAVSRLSGSRLLLRRWKKGIPEYRTIIFVRHDSGIQRLADLKGKMIALEEPFSSSGYFIPKLVLFQAGLKPTPKTDSSEAVGPGEVGYVFSGDDESTMVWLLRGKVMAGATDDRTFLKEARGNMGSLRILHKSSPFPRHIVSHRADLSPQLVTRIREVLLKMDQSEEGKKALRGFELTTKFDEIPAEAMASLLKAGRLIDLEVGAR